MFGGGILSGGVLRIPSNVDKISVTNSFFSFRIIRLVSKPLSEKKGLIISKTFCCRLSPLYLD